MRKLQNPKLPNYTNLKEFILGDNFPWFYNKHFVYKENKDHYIESDEKFSDISFYTHSFLNRPKHTGEKYPTANSPHVGAVSEVLNSIFAVNDIEVNCIYRMNANLLHPSKTEEKTLVHVDHSFPHKNLLIYLTDAGGKTVCGEDVHDPKEDDIIIFEGKHYNFLPENNRRIVIVATYI